MQKSGFKIGNHEDYKINLKLFDESSVYFELLQQVNTRFFMFLERYRKIEKSITADMKGLFHKMLRISQVRWNSFQKVSISK